MKRILTILTLTLTLTAAAQAQRQMKVYMKGGLVDKVQVDANATVGHSRTDLNGTVHDDYVSMVLKDAEGHNRQYLISQLDSLVMPNGRRVVFYGSTLSQPVYSLSSPERAVVSPRQQPRRSSFTGTFPGQGENNVKFKWTEYDRIRLDVGYESRAEQLSADGTSASFVFDGADDLTAERYLVYFPDRSVTIKSVQTQRGADNTLHIYESGDCGTATATQSPLPTQGGDGGGSERSYSFTLEHKSAYICFLPHIDHLPSAKLTRITLTCSAAIAGTYQLSPNGLYNASNTSTKITLNLVPQRPTDFFIGHDALTEQDSCAAYMVIAPQTSSQTFTATYYITDTLSHISKVYRQTFSFQPVANTVYPVTCHILDEEFRTIDLGLSCNWSNVNVGATEPSLPGSTFTSDAAANAALLAQTVVTQWLIPDADQKNEILEKCAWTAGTYNAQPGYFVEGAAVAKEYGERLRIFIPCTANSTPVECLAQNYRPVEALMVDLGLSSGVKWAARNIGANSVEDYGHYFAWGEVEPKDSYNSTTYLYGTQTLGDNYDISGTQNDAAVINWGGLWRMPTKDEMAELANECNWSWSPVNGVNGFIVTGLTGNKIFLPATGLMENGSLIYGGSGGTYYTSTLAGDRSNAVYTLYWQINQGSDLQVLATAPAWHDYYKFSSWERPVYRYYGRTIRPVTKPTVTSEDGNSYTVVTDSAMWKCGDSEVTLFGTLSSSLPIKGTVTVGFIVGDSAQIVMGKSRYEFSKTTAIGGSFSQTLPVYDNIGYWYRAYLLVDGVAYYGSPRHYGYEFVDLGLDSGTLWANMNVGANQPSDYGNYYAWGEVETKESFTRETYKYGTQNIGMDFDIAGTDYDVAHMVLGNAWRMPTKAQMEELKNDCDWTWTSKDNVNGYLITGSNGNSIFLPATGLKDGVEIINSVKGGTYYTSTMSGDRSDNIYTLYWQIDQGSDLQVLATAPAWHDYYKFSSWERPVHRYYGRTIRAVFMPNAPTADNIMAVCTDSASWKVDNASASAKVYGTLSSTQPLAEGTKVGFVIGNSPSVDKLTAVTKFTQTKTTTGSFCETVGNIMNNMGYWYRAYVETPSEEVFYGEPKYFGWEKVDLGLPSGTLWANMNVGASAPEDYGNYFAWGEVETKGSYASGNYLYGTQNLSDDLNIAATQYDAAYTNMNEEWCMPTSAQMDELLTQCDWIWTGHNGVNGYLIKSLTNGNSIFLPAAGFMENENLIYNNCGGTYFTSTLGSSGSNAANVLYWQKDYAADVKVSASVPAWHDYYKFSSWERPVYRYYGRPIRAVARQGVAQFGGVVLNVTTDAPEWTEGTSEATIKGTLVSNEALTSDVTVGFLVTNHFYTDKATMKTHHDIVVSAAGEFSLVQEITSDDGLYYTAYIKVGDRYYYGKTRHAGLREMVNLGLPSGKLWANINLGATAEDEPGFFFAWGETGTKTVFDASTYQWNSDEGYTDIGDNISGTEYDAARALWQGGWRMPTESEFSELISNCDWSYVIVNGHPCYKAKSRVSDAYVLFPEGGIKIGSTVENDSNWAFYWTSDKNGDINAHRTNFYGQGSCNMYSDDRAFGLLIKPIVDR